MLCEKGLIPKQYHIYLLQFSKEGFNFWRKFKIQIQLLEENKNDIDSNSDSGSEEDGSSDMH